jgi:UDP-N-acetyl-alpha-D-quinovosamine dehydrogenase
MKVRVTGANGFIGHHLIHKLLEMGHNVCAVVRSEKAAHSIPDSVDTCVISDPQDVEQWREALAGSDTVIHLIGLAHAAAQDKTNLMNRFREVNVELTERVVDACIHGNVHRLIYLSSIKAVGEGASTPYTEGSQCSPENAYGESKREAELLIQERAQGTPLEASLIRPPVVYGPGAKGNIVRMMKLVRSRLPLPIRCLKAQRSMVYVGNLVDALCFMVTAEQPVEGIFHISDPGIPLTTREMLLQYGRFMGRTILEVPVPALLLRVMGRLVGMGDVVDRLTQPLTTQGLRLANDLGWRPPYSMQEGLSATVKWFVEHERDREEA